MLEFCSRQGARHGLANIGSVAAICRHIEDRLLGEIIRSATDGRIAGNTGMTHGNLAVAAQYIRPFGETEQWLDWLFHPNFPLTDPNARVHRDAVPWVMVAGLDRDGIEVDAAATG